VTTATLVYYTWRQVDDRVRGNIITELRRQVSQQISGNEQLQVGKFVEGVIRVRVSDQLRDPISSMLLEDIK
jgi:hypothetical protein